MLNRPKLLLLDDDEFLLQVYQGILARLPSQPAIHVASSGGRAIALLESEPFNLLISDLNMPKMDGLQVLSIVRRKFPQLRTVVLTSVMEEQFRARAYAIGVDLFLQKPSTSQEISMFLDCIESLLGMQEASGFRGVQSKSLVDIIQMECLSHSSSVMKISNGSQVGKIWFIDGDVIDATIDDLSGEEAFKKILFWKTGNFETLPAEPGHPRVITSSYQGLLLETAQSADEAESKQAGGSASPVEPGATAPPSAVATIARIEGVDFVLTASNRKPLDVWGVDNRDKVAEWTQDTAKRFAALGDKLGLGQFNHLEAIGQEHHVGVVTSGDVHLCVGFQRSLSRETLRETLKQILSKWAS